MSQGCKTLDASGAESMFADPGLALAANQPASGRRCRSATAPQAVAINSRTPATNIPGVMLPRRSWSPVIPTSASNSQSSRCETGWVATGRA